MPQTLRNRTYEFLEPKGSEDRLAVYFDRFMIYLIIANVIAITLESVKEIHEAYQGIFYVFELLSIVIFSAEYIARVWSAPETPNRAYQAPISGRLKYMFTPLALVDLAAILPFFLTFFFVIDLRFMRVFRLLRLFKLTRYSPALVTVGAVLMEQRRQLGAALVIMLTLLVFSSSVAYLLEKDAQPENFASIPQSMWWAMATLTTVGFGDVTPITTFGKIFGAFLMVMGVGMYALPAGILATGFAREFKKREFTVTWKMVASVPAFANLDAVTIAEISSALKPSLIPAHYTIVKRGEAADGMYFIAEGEVEVDLHPIPIHLVQGEFFGEIALIFNRTRSATVTATTDCHLLMLERQDFEDLMNDHPILKEHIEEVATKRLHEIEKLSNII